ncbi:glycerophosphoryl diester phosphodiesterase [Paenibacillus sophorae]|uniref:Glycerophosphodiester phosphodiesterase n=1 Tax=Paenibacillus sophorae TaxID=1333845 RepID=A0A1H8RYR4_9BACL|nr:glycerophosphodiester phosphodiesterase [Paenibacillus sophorae]QWU16915.1 glycerophosphodiester phosphodiesterase [Paenibacillus sophorae]SEO71502.1 glycerophosphoryl diester phosphodiesterase [Paenibacillus sophorae]
MNAVPLITAHTGCMNTPDNSLLSIETGLANGADIIEDDIRVTRDGTPVLSHDDAVRLANGSMGRLSQMTISELNEGQSIPIVKLEQALHLVRNSGKTMNLDLKADECIEPVSELAKKLGMIDRVFLSGCEADRARKAKHSSPRLRKLLNVNSGLFLNGSYTEAVLQTFQDAESAGCFGINVPYRLVEPYLLEKAAESGFQIYIWTVDEEKDMRLYAGMGIHSITTRNVADLVRVKKELLTEGS